MHDDLLSLMPKVDFTRRGFVVTSLAAGFALAVQPVSAETITTDAKGLEAGEVKVPVNYGGKEGEMPAYRAMPDKGGPFPVVLVVQEIFGVHEHIKDVCRRFAKLGYFAIAPELYVRQGDVSKLESFDDILKIVQQVPDAQVMSDLDAAVEYAKKSGKGDVAKMGVTGFCWGGRIVWLYAAHSKQVKAAVAWYGRLSGNSSELSPKHPIDVVADLNAPVLGLYGGKDTGIPQESIEQMRTAAKKAKVPVEIVVYPDAQHGFHADYRPSYNEKDAKDGWSRLQSWFKKYGAA
ncbi:MAG: dienelactone hydrolase family protein [Povalibacter sp.]